MSTVTITQAQPPVNYFSAIKDIRTILLAHQHNKDFLSCQLLSWGCDVIQSACDHANDSVENVYAVAQKQLQVLQKHLTDPIFQAPLKEPVLERDWVWESGIHDCYLQHFESSSPLDEQPMDPHPPIHQLAREMIQWKNRILPENDISNPSAQLVHIQAGPEEIRSMYLMAAERAKFFRQNQQLRHQMKMALQATDNQIAVMEQRSGQLIQDALRKAHAHEADLRASFEMIQKIHAQEIGELNGQMTVLDTAYQQNLSALEQQIQSTDQANQQVRSALKEQLVRLQEEHESARNVLSQEIDQAHGKNEQLANQLTDAMRINDEALASVVQNNAKTVGSLESQLQEQTTDIGQLRGALDVSSRQNAQNYGEIQNLRLQNAQQAATIAELGRRISHSSDCTIL
ncbi:MAG: hypothetical protein HW387_1364 [Parachlamydiales bacterium]|nr:hypothetical protein [Parachlamydiales bacterium]